MGNSVKEILYDTSVPIKKNELCTPVDTGSDDKGDEILDSEHEELWRNQICIYFNTNVFILLRNIVNIFVFYYFINYILYRLL